MGTNYDVSTVATQAIPLWMWITCVAMAFVTIGLVVLLIVFLKKWHNMKSTDRMKNGKIIALTGENQLLASVNAKMAAVSWNVTYDEEGNEKSFFFAFISSAQDEKSKYCSFILYFSILHKTKHDIPTPQKTKRKIYNIRLNPSIKSDEYAYL